MGLLESAAAILTNGEKRLETISQNISNASTPSYKRQIAFSRLLEGNNGIGDYAVPVSVSIDASPGKYVESGNPLDLAIVGTGLFMVRDGDRYYYTRGGQFSRDREGAVVNAQGMRLQQSGGGDLVLNTDDIEISEDGTVLADGAPAGALAIYEPGDNAQLVHSDGSLFTANSGDMSDGGDSLVRQGFVENSNVVLSDEMVNLLANNRQVEMGGQLVRTYDQLVGQAITTFTRNGR